MLRSLSGACAALALTTIVASADGVKPKENDAGPVGSAKMTLEAAVGIAEKHASGKAVRAG